MKIILNKTTIELQQISKGNIFSVSTQSCFESDFNAKSNAFVDKVPSCIVKFALKIRRLLMEWFTVFMHWLDWEYSQRLCRLASLLLVIGRNQWLFHQDWTSLIYFCVLRKLITWVCVMLGEQRNALQLTTGVVHGHIRFASSINYFLLLPTRCAGFRYSKWQLSVSVRGLCQIFFFTVFWSVQNCEFEVISGIICRFCCRNEQLNRCQTTSSNISNIKTSWYFDIYAPNLFRWCSSHNFQRFSGNFFESFPIFSGWFAVAVKKDHPRFLIS